MLTALLSILPVFAIILTGYVAGRTKVIDPSYNRVLNRFVIWLPLPALLFYVMATTDWHSVWDSKYVIASVGGSLVLFAVGLGIGRVRGLTLSDIAVDGMAASHSNSAYIGLPLFLLALGPASTPFAILGAVLPFMALFPICIFLSEMGRSEGHEMGHALAKAGLGVIRNPIVIAPLAGTLWWLTGEPLPAPVREFTHILGNAASPTALVAIGLLLAERPLLEAIGNKAVLGLSAAKLVVHPLVTAAIAYPLLGMTPYSAAMAIVFAALPTGTGSFMLSGLYGRDGQVASGTIFLTTLLSVLTLTACLSFLPR